MIFWKMKRLSGDNISSLLASANGKIGYDILFTIIFIDFHLNIRQITLKYSYSPHLAGR